METRGCLLPWVLSKMSSRILITVIIMIKIVADIDRPIDWNLFVTGKEDWRVLIIIWGPVRWRVMASELGGVGNTNS